MPIAHLWDAHNENTASLTTLAITSGIAAIGSTVFVNFATDSANGTTCTCADSKGNTYTQQLDQNASVGAQTHQYVFRAPITVALVGTDTITLTLSVASTRRAGYATAYSGLDNSAAADKTTTGNGTTVASMSGMSTAAIAQPDELQLTLFALNVTNATTSTYTDSGTGQTAVGSSVQTAGATTDKSAPFSWRIHTAVATPSSAGVSGTNIAGWLGAIRTYRGYSPAKGGIHAVKRTWAGR